MDGASQMRAIFQTSKEREKEKSHTHTHVYIFYMDYGSNIHRQTAG
jgi:hypothetical protein